jgi:hypothetical protein
MKWAQKDTLNPTPNTKGHLLFTCFLMAFVGSSQCWNTNTTHDSLQHSVVTENQHLFVSYFTLSYQLLRFVGHLSNDANCNPE